MANVKITVVKKVKGEDLRLKYNIPGEEECPKFGLGDEFISKGSEMPEGFCDWAWGDIRKDVAVLAYGGNFPWIKEKGLKFVCCGTGLHPVVFKLKRIEK
jgi:uncharacterized repeat protein (TIGR04076 family)